MVKYKIVVNNLEKQHEKTTIITPHVTNYKMALVWLGLNAPYRYYGIVSSKKECGQMVPEYMPEKYTVQVLGKGGLRKMATYFCPRCGKCVVGLRNLRKHMEKEHNWLFEKPTERP